METITIKGKRIPVPWLYCETRTLVGESTIVSASREEFLDSSYYGGHIICSGVEPAYKPLIIAAPDLFTRLKNLVADVSSGSLDSDSLQEAAALIEELEAT